MAKHLRSNGINEERAKAKVCRWEIAIRHSKRITVRKGKGNREAEMGVGRNMNRKEEKIWEQIWSNKYLSVWKNREKKVVASSGSI